MFGQNFDSLGIRLVSVLSGFQGIFGLLLNLDLSIFVALGLEVKSCVL